MLTILQPLELTNLALCASAQERGERSRPGPLLCRDTTILFNGFETAPSL